MASFPDILLVAIRAQNAINNIRCCTIEMIDDVKSRLGASNRGT